MDSTDSFIRLQFERSNGETELRRGWTGNGSRFSTQGVDIFVEKCCDRFITLSEFSGYSKLHNKCALIGPTFLLTPQLAKRCLRNNRVINFSWIVGWRGSFKRPGSGEPFCEIRSRKRIVVFLNGNDQLGLFSRPSLKG